MALGQMGYAVADLNSLMWQSAVRTLRDPSRHEGAAHASRADMEPAVEDPEGHVPTPEHDLHRAAWVRTSTDKLMSVCRHWFGLLRAVRFHDTRLNFC